MKQARVLGLCSLGVLLALTGAVRADELKLGAGSGRLGDTVSVPLTLTSTGQVQGLVAAFDWDAAKLQGANLVSGAAIASANVIVPRVENGFAVLGVVMDSDGVGNEIIPPGTDSPIATVQVKCLGPSGDTEDNAPLVFRDGQYNTNATSPPLDNIIVIGGLSIGKREGLVLTNGNVRCQPAPIGSYTITNTSGQFGDCVKVPVVLGNQSPVQGYVVAIQHPAGLTLNKIEVGAAAAAADFAQPEIFPTGGTLGVVMDLFEPFTGATIAPGANNVIASYQYCSAARDCSDPATTADYALHFVDFQLGDPSKENVIVVGGRSKNPELHDGTLSLTSCVPPPAVGLTFAVGACQLEGAKDNQSPAKVQAHPGDNIQVGLWYKSPEDNNPDEATQTDHLQGVSMAVCFDPACLTCAGTFSLEGTITQTVGAEFVNVHCKNGRSPTEELGPRPGELIVGILVDALPPFDGQELPPTNDYLLLVCVNFQLSASAKCNTCCPITFCDGAVGAGRVPIRNLASVMNQSVKPQLVNGEVCVLAEPTFIRGDCNFSDGAPDRHGPVAVDISDAASVISFLFLTGTWKFHPPCLDACDANDDGRVDLADAVFILRYLFKFDREPKAPFPNPGPDPTYDKLSCDGGAVCNS
jgi:hypothetical protein